MDYKEWGAEYLEEAGRLKNRVDMLRHGFAGLKDEEAIRLSRRIAMLYGMYLECLHTGRLLAERGRADEQKKEGGRNAEL